MTNKIFRSSFLVSVAVVLASLVLFTGILYDYFEIFLDRMILCRKAAETLGLQFKFMINETLIRRLPNGNEPDNTTIDHDPRLRRLDSERIRYGP